MKLDSLNFLLFRVLWEGTIPHVEEHQEVLPREVCYQKFHLSPLVVLVKNLRENISCHQVTFAGSKVYGLSPAGFADPVAVDSMSPIHMTKCLVLASPDISQS